MRIAQIAPLTEAVPPHLYGGTERVVAHLCDSLVGLGHDVTLFAAAESCTRANLVASRDMALRLDDAPLKSDLAAHLAMLHEVRRRARDFDVLHFHIDLLHFPMFEHCASKTLTTLHGRLDLKDLPQAYARWPQYGLVSISNSQRLPLPDAHWLKTVPHGVPAAQFPYCADPRGGYLAFLGRISPEKRPDIAIQLARSAGLPLRIAAKVDRPDVHYFETQIKPLLDDPLIEYIGEIGDTAKAQFLGQASALLFPIHWPEPFGLVMIEAMACGTPVIAWNCGSAPEVIQPGVNGFIVSSEAEAQQAIKRIPELDRRAVRASFERLYTSNVMASAYVELYRRLVHTNAPAAMAPIARTSHGRA
jgi:glycosyltransferase involved in cell wall biosynthesis